MDDDDDDNTIKEREKIHVHIWKKIKFLHILNGIWDMMKIYDFSQRHYHQTKYFLHFHFFYLCQFFSIFKVKIVAQSWFSF